MCVCLYAYICVCAFVCVMAMKWEEKGREEKVREGRLFE